MLCHAINKNVLLQNKLTQHQQTYTSPVPVSNGTPTELTSETYQMTLIRPTRLQPFAQSEKVKRKCDI